MQSRYSKTNKKKICFVSPAIYPLLNENSNVRSAGGAEAQFAVVGKELAKIGYQVHFITDDYDQQNVVKIDSVWVHKTSFRYLRGGKHSLLNDWLKLIFLIRKINADYFLLKVPKDLLLPIGIFCCLKQRKLIYVGQSDKDVDLKLLFKLQNKFAVCLYRVGLFFVDYAIAQTQIQLKGFKKLRKVTSIIKNVVTLPQARPERKKNILWVGNDTSNKQAELVPELALKLPAYTFKMILSTACGSKSDIVFRKKSREIENFDYIGFVPFNEIGSYFSKATLLINTSIREGFPNVFLQAWQNGTPVISLNVDPDGVINKNGIGVCVSGHLDNMCKNIKFFMRNPDFVKEMQKKALDYVNNEHSLQKGVAEYIKIFESL